MRKADEGCQVPVWADSVQLHAVGAPMQPGPSETLTTGRTLGPSPPLPTGRHWDDTGEAVVHWQFLRTTIQG